MTRQNQSPSWTVEAFAKLNLYLALRGRRADGYHLLEMLNVPVTLSDTVSLALGAPDLADSVDVVCDPELRVSQEVQTELRDPARNLAVRGARAMLELIGERRSVKLEIQKRIPLGAGMGGGSADAAAAMRAVEIALGLRGERDEVYSAALRLGADVPYFLDSRPAVVSGVGDIITRASVERLEELEFILVLPSFGVPTVEVYREVREKHSGVWPTRSALTVTDRGESVVVNLSASHLRNDLEPFACALRPSLGEILAKLRGVAEDLRREDPSGLTWAGMTGSGSVLYIALSGAQTRRALPRVERAAAALNCGVKIVQARLQPTGSLDIVPA